MGEYLANLQIVCTKLGSEVCAGQSEDRPSALVHTLPVLPVYMFMLVE